VLTVDRSGLDLDTSEIETAFEDLPAVLQSAVARLRAHEQTEQAEHARRALVHLYRLVRS
jgi:hypothetical protein